MISGDFEDLIDLGKELFKFVMKKENEKQAQIQEEI